MRNQLFFCCLIISILCAGVGVVSGAQAHVKTKHAIDLQLMGQIDMGVIQRNNAFNNAYWGPCIDGGTQEVSRANGVTADGRRIAPAINSATGSLFVIDPQLSVGLEATLPSNVIAMIELSTPFYVIGDEGGSTSVRKSDLTIRNYEYQRYLVVEQAYVELRDLFVQDSGMDLRLGITDYSFDFRGNGNPFLIDIQNAENPFLSPTGAQQYLIVDQDGDQKWDAESANDARIDPGPFGRNSQEAVGVLVRYTTPRGLVSVDGYLFDIYESYNMNRDDFITGVTATINFDEEKRYGKVAPTFLVMSNDSTAAIYTFGAGAQYYPIPDILEVYAEGYYQWGNYAKNVDVGGAGSWGARHFDEILQNKAYAFYAGLRLGSPRSSYEDVSTMSTDDDSLDLLGGWQPYVDCSYWEISGDDEADDSYNSNFVSLENNNLTLIAESSYWGLDIDTNYRAVRLQAGCYPLSSLHAQATYAYLEYQDNNGSVDNHTGRAKNKIGDEVDLTLTYEYSTHVKFRLGTGFLFDPRALGTSKTLNLNLFQAIVDF